MGSWKALIHNHGNMEIFFQAGDKIAQAIFERIENKLQVEEVQQLNTTQRGSQAFGLSNKQAEAEDRQKKREERFYKEIEEGIVPMR